MDRKTTLEEWDKSEKITEENKKVVLTLESWKPLTEINSKITVASDLSDYSTNIKKFSKDYFDKNFIEYFKVLDDRKTFEKREVPHYLTQFITELDDYLRNTLKPILITLNKIRT